MVIIQLRIRGQTVCWLVLAYCTISGGSV